MTITGSRGFPDGYLAPGSSFLDFAAQHAPTIMPGTQPTFDTIPQDIAPHGTTIVALEYHNGIIIAGDRRATMGTTIAHREIEKVFAADEHSAIAIAGTAGLAIELVRLFQLELEHYEKIEGTPLSLDGKANRLSTMLKSHLHLALQGLPIVPIFAGWDSTRHQGRLFAYDVTGGRYEEPNFTCAGSGSVFARSALKKLWKPQLDATRAITIALEALWDAADDDTATAGPDIIRRIWPIIAVIDHKGFRYVSEADLAHANDTIAHQRSQDHQHVRVLEPGRDGPGNRLPSQGSATIIPESDQS